MTSTSASTRRHTDHALALSRLRESWRNLPADRPVRLAKSTTNLFRPPTQRRPASAEGLDVSGLDGVLHVDPSTRTAEVQGMCTYERLLAATLEHGLAPLVVPQLRTITLGGAVAGLGVEATSFRNGLPHESVLEMDVLVGTGEVVTCRPGDDLFDTFPNSYGSLGYAVRLVVELEPVGDLVGLHHLRFRDVDQLVACVEEVVASRTHGGYRVDAMDGIALAPDDLRLTLATYGVGPGWAGHRAPSDYTGQQVFHASVRDRMTDLLTAEDFFWRWDTDWFWCSAAFGVQRPAVRRLWPRRLRRSDVYMKLVSLDRRYGVVDRLDRVAGRPQRERVVQDVEVPVERTGEFLAWFDEAVGMRPVWLCPLRLRGDRSWPLYPLDSGRTYVNVGFWGTVPVGPGADDHPLNRAVEREVDELGGHKSLYSEAFYDRTTFDRLYGGEHLVRVKAVHDPDSRLDDAFTKVVGRR